MGVERGEGRRMRMRMRRDVNRSGDDVAGYDRIGYVIDAWRYMRDCGLKNAEQQYTIQYNTVVMVMGEMGPRGGLDTLHF